MLRSYHVVALVLLIVLIAGCAAPAQPVPPTAAPAAAPTAAPAASQPAAKQGGGQNSGAQSGAAPGTGLKIGGKVAKEMTWTEEQVHAMPTADAKSANQKGETQTYSGVPLNDLLKLASVQSGATTLVFSGEGGATSEAALGAVQACSDCIVSFRSRGGFSLILPGFPENVQLKGVTGITVK